MTMPQWMDESASIIPTNKRVWLSLTSNADLPAAACVIDAWAGSNAGDVATTTDGNTFGFIVDSDWCSSALSFDGGTTNLCPLTAGATVSVPHPVTTSCTPTNPLTTVAVASIADQLTNVGTAITPIVPSATQNPDYGYSVFWAVEPPLPAGLSIDPTTGHITGTPVNEQTQRQYALTAHTRGGTGARLFNLTVRKPLNTVTVGAIADQAWTNGTPITPITPSATDSDSSITTFTWSISPALPTGVTLNASTGQISGTPTATAAQTAYTLTATDAVGSTGSKTFNITVS